MDIVIIFQKTIGWKHHGYLGKPTVVVSLLELTASSAIVSIRSERLAMDTHHAVGLKSYSESACLPL